MAASLHVRILLLETVISYDCWICVRRNGRGDHEIDQDLWGRSLNSIRWHLKIAPFLNATVLSRKFFDPLSQGNKNIKFRFFSVDCTIPHVRYHNFYMIVLISVSELINEGLGWRKENRTKCKRLAESLGLCYVILHCMLYINTVSFIWRENMFVYLSANMLREACFLAILLKKYTQFYTRNNPVHQLLTWKVYSISLKTFF